MSLPLLGLLIGNPTVLSPGGKPVVKANLGQIVKVYRLPLTSSVNHVHLVDQGIGNMDSSQGREGVVRA